jgi:Pectate lyase superfamily protein
VPLDNHDAYRHFPTIDAANRDPTFFMKLLLKPGCRSSTSFAALIAVLLFWSGAAHAASFYPVRPADPRAVDFTAEAFGAHADGAGDDSDALQRAIDRVQETTGAGVLLIPEGRYLLSKTVHVWQGIRLLGYGATRPVFVLAKDTPGFQEGTGRYMVHFADNRPDPGGPIVDATARTGAHSI